MVSVDAKSIEQHQDLTADLYQTLSSNKIQAALVPADFEGLGMCRKDICKIYEVRFVVMLKFVHRNLD